jgi:hypothetical protein
MQHFVGFTYLPQRLRLRNREARRGKSAARRAAGSEDYTSSLFYAVFDYAITSWCLSIQS